MTPETPQNVKEYLQSLQPGYLPQDVFREFARLAVLTTIELVPIRVTGDRYEVLLLQRPASDTWSGLWHVPGTVIRTGDEMKHGHDYDGPLQRLIGPGGEIDSIEIVGMPVEVETERRRTDRGDELSVIHYVEVTGDAPVGRFFDIADYPANVPAPGIVPHHDDFIKRAVAAFKLSR